LYHSNSKPEGLVVVLVVVVVLVLVLVMGKAQPKCKMCPNWCCTNRHYLYSLRNQSKKLNYSNSNRMRMIRNRIPKQSKLQRARFEAWSSPDGVKG
jgi:hypothetical protein